VTHFYVIYAFVSDDSYDSADLIVEAKDKDEALSLWRQHYGFGPNEGELNNVFKLPVLSGASGVIDWNNMNP
jgi:hypothetical protein